MQGGNVPLFVLYFLHVLLFQTYAKMGITYQLGL